MVSKKILSGLFIFILIYPTLKAQEKQLHFFVSGATAKIRNENYTGDEYLEVRYPVCFNSGITFTRGFAKYFGITFGAELSNYKNYLICKEYYQSSSTVKGPDGSDYYPIYIADYYQKRTFYQIEFPLLFRMETSKVEGKPSLFFEAGPKLGMEVSSRLESKGEIVTKGIWPTGNPYWYQLSQNNPYYGFKTNNVISSNDYNFNRVNYSAFFQLGFAIPFRNALSFNCSLYRTVGLNDINNTDKGLVYTNFLGERSEYKPSKISSTGLRFGLTMRF